MISCIVIEDQMPARKILQKYIGDVEALELKEMFSNALHALDYLRDNTVDLIFLDIHLPKLSGIDFLELLQKQPKVILTTAFPDYALQGYELDVVDYLLKPFSFERFLKAVVKVERQMNETTTRVKSEKSTSIIVKVGYDLVKLQLAEINFIQADGDYSTLFCKGKKLHASYPLKHWTDTLPQETFMQVHRSFVVNVQEVEKATSSTLTIGETEIPLGRVYKKDFQKVYFGLQKE